MNLIHSELPIEIINLFKGDHAIHEIDILLSKESLKQFYNQLVPEMERVPIAETKIDAPDLPLASDQRIDIPNAAVNLRDAQTEKTLRKLRITLRSIVIEIKKIRPYAVFFKPLNENRYEGFYEEIEKPIDMFVVEKRIDMGYYTSFKRFKEDINIMYDNLNHYMRYRQDKYGILSKVGFRIMLILGLFIA